MSRKSFTVIAMVLLGCFWLVVNQEPSVGQQGVNRPRALQWEYHAIASSGEQVDTNSLNAAGLKGWELIQVWSPRKGAVNYILKRHK